MGWGAAARVELLTEVAASPFREVGRGAGALRPRAHRLGDLHLDERWRLRLVNRAGERLLAAAEQLHGRTAAELGVEAFLTGDDTRTAEIVLPGGHGRFRIRRTTFRQSGVPHVLLSMSDLSRALREEERQAWQRLLRVLSHELNNSLAPIRSIAGSLGTILKREPLPDGWQDDAQQGLEVIDLRAAALTRFLQAYSELARLPQPVLRPIDVGETVRRVAGLETRVAVAVEAGPELTIHADGDHSSNSSSTSSARRRRRPRNRGRVTMTWSASADSVEISVAARRRHQRHRQPLHPLLHHQTRRHGNRPDPRPPDRRSPQRGSDALERSLAWGRRAIATAAAISDVYDAAQGRRFTTETQRHRGSGGIALKKNLRPPLRLCVSVVNRSLWIQRETLTQVPVLSAPQRFGEKAEQERESA